ncbi:uncharacterized protein IWZ02DRAFT_464929 [Phyllosticta citriasiana]|uniref:uncharacterized protein n=1 Tax=Phyllosticta citriasiana TaxID=595635 RepID=UPI0030FD2BC7
MTPARNASRVPSYQRDRLSQRVASTKQVQGQRISSPCKGLVALLSRGPFLSPSAAPRLGFKLLQRLSNPCEQPPFPGLLWPGPGLDLVPLYMRALAGCLSPPAGNSHVFMSIALTTTISQQPLRAPTTIRGVPGVRHGQVVLFGGFSSCPTADPQGQAMVPAAAMLTARPLAKFWLHTPVMHMRVIWLHDAHGTDVGGLGRGVGGG